MYVQRHSTPQAKRLQHDLTHYDRHGVAVLPTGFKSALFFMAHYGCPACDGSGRDCLVDWRKEARRH